MATVEKLKQKKKGKVYKSSTWYIRYSYPAGKRRRIAAWNDRQSSKQLAANIEKLIACRASDMPAPKYLTEIIEKLPERIRNHLQKVGLLDVVQVKRSKLLTDHLQGWGDHLRAKGDSERHIRQRLSRAEKLLDAAGATWWSDISINKVETALINFRDVKDLSVSTVNAYQSALKQFTRWMYKNGYVAEDPLRHLSRQNPAPHLRCKRRALTKEECLKLLKTTSESEQYRDGASPCTRELFYRMALETGLRFNELKTLKVHHLNLTDSPPTVSIEAGYSKSKRADILPLRNDLAEDLRRHCDAKEPENKVFDMWKAAQGARMLKADLVAAEIPYKDSQGRQADFHALRHTFITNLARSGVHPKTAQTLARHSTMELTMKVYTMVALDTKEDAVNQLPDLHSI